MSKDHSDKNCDCHNGDSGWFPLNSKVQVQKNRSIFIQAPAGWAYVGQKEGSTQVLKVATGGTTVSCTCNSTGDCLPFTASGPKGSASGCAGSCTNCSMKQSALVSGREVVFERGGYIDFSAKTDFANTAIELPAAFSAMFQLPEVKQSLKDFLDRVYGGLPFPKMIIGENFVSAPDGYSMAAVSIFGRAAMVPVPTIALRTVTAGGTKATCSCSQGSCVAETTSIPFVGSATFCKGSCSGTCTLSNAIIIGNGDEVALYTSISYRY